MSVLSALLWDLQASAEVAMSDAGRDYAASVIVNGEIAWDERCGGYLFVRLGGVTPQGGSPGCPALFSNSIYVGVLRCVNVGTAEVPPTTEVMTEETMEALEDKAALEKMLCNFNWTAYTSRMQYINWTPLGRNGGLAGGEWQIEVRMPTGCGC